MSTNHTPEDYQMFTQGAFVALRLAQRDNSDGKRDERRQRSRQCEAFALCAPELLDALKEAENQLDTFMGDSRKLSNERVNMTSAALRQIRAAIAKAISARTST